MSSIYGFCRKSRFFSLYCLSLWSYRMLILFNRALPIIACVYLLLNDNQKMFVFLFSFHEYFSFQMTIKIQEIYDAKYIYLIFVEDRFCTAFVFYFSVGFCFNTACYHNFFPAQYLYIKIQVFYKMEMKGNNCFHIFFKIFQMAVI